METKNSKTLELVSGAQTALDKLHNRFAELEEEDSHLKAKLGAEDGDADAPETSEAFDCLAVTNVQVFPFKEGMYLGSVKAMASVELNDQLQIRGLRVVNGQNGLFVGYPCDPFFKGEESRYVCNPITRQLREHIEACVLEKYNQVTEG